MKTGAILVIVMALSMLSQGFALGGCNYRMIFRDFNFQYQMGYGTNIIEFTPQKTGNFQYTCWMGMIYGTVNVIE